MNVFLLGSEAEPRKIGASNNLLLEKKNNLQGSRSEGK